MVSRQVYFDGRPFTHFAVNLHVPARLLDEAIYLREAETRALSDILGGIEGIERFCFDVRRHSDSRIGHCDYDVLARQHLRLSRRIEFIEMDIGCLDRQLAST